jgi:hypothetical protein
MIYLPIDISKTCTKRAGILGDSDTLGKYFNILVYEWYAKAWTRAPKLESETNYSLSLYTSLVNVLWLFCSPRYDLVQGITAEPQVECSVAHLSPDIVQSSR